jgi:fumarate hydratase subunit beta
MDAYTPSLLDLGLRGMVGKGYRNAAVKEAMVRNRAVYFAAVGGAAALGAQAVTGSRIVAYEDLGPEAIRELDVVDFPVIVVNDIYGGDLYEQGRREFERSVAT